MKTFKKLFSVSAIVALLGTLAPMYAFAAGNSLDGDPEFPEAYAYAYKYGITTQSEDNVNMGGNLTRIAMAKMIAQYAINVLGMELPETAENCTFVDVTAALDEQYDNGVTNACKLGLMGQNMPGNKFRPDDNVTRAEFGTTLSRALNHDSDNLAEMNAATPYYKDHLNFLNEKGIMKNISDPTMQEKRGYVMIMMMRADDSYVPAKGCEQEEILSCLAKSLAGEVDYDACKAACASEDPEEEEPVGNAEVRVSAKAEASQDVALNAVNKKIGTVTLKASSESDAVISTIVVNHSGLGDAKTVQLQLYKDGKTVSTKKTMGSNNTVTLKLSPALTIKAGSSMTLDVMASMVTAKPNDTHSFSVESVNVANGKSTGTPVSLGTIRTTSYAVGTTTATLTKKNDITAGDTNKLFASVKISTKAKSNIDGFTISLNDVLADTTTPADDIDMDELLANVKAYINNKEVGKVTINEDAIIVSDLNLAKNSNESVTVDLKGDGIYVGPTGKIAFIVKANDVAAIETATNENMANNDSNVIDVNAAGVNLTITKLTKEAKTYAAGTNDIELFSAKVTSDIDFDITDYDIIIDSPAAEYCTDNTSTTKAACETAGETRGFFPIFDKVTVLVDGVDTEITDTTASTINFGKDDSFSVGPKNSATIKVLGDAKGELNAAIVAAANAKTYQITLKIKKVTNPETDKSITLTTAKTRQGDTVKVQNGTYTVTKTANAPVSKTVLQGTEANIAYFDVKTKSEDGTLDTVTIELNATATTTTNKKFSDFATEVTLMKGDTEVKTIDDATTLNATTLTFNDLGESLTDDVATSYTIKASIKNDAELSKNIQADVKTTVVKNNAGIALTAPALLAGKTYQIVRTMPTVTLTKDGEYILVKVDNNTDEDITLKELVLKVSNNVIGNEGGTVDWANTTLKVLDGKGGTAIGATADKVPGTATLDLTTATNTVAANSSLEFVVEMNPSVTLLSDYYEVAKKSIKFKFANGANDVTETY